MCGILDLVGPDYLKSGSYVESTFREKIRTNYREDNIPDGH